MNEIEQLQEQLANITAERDALAAEVKRLKSGNGFDDESYIKRLQEQAQRDKQATQDLVSRFL